MPLTTITTAITTTDTHMADAWNALQGGDAGSSSASSSDREGGFLSDDSLDLAGAECLLAPSSSRPTSGRVSRPGRMPERSRQRSPLTVSQCIWVGGVLLLISSLVLSSEAILWDYFHTAYRQGMYPLRAALARYIGPLSLGIVALYTSYLSAVLSDPGTVDARGWVPPVSAFPEVVTALDGLPGSSLGSHSLPSSVSSVSFDRDEEGDNAIQGNRGASRDASQSPVSRDLGAPAHADAVEEPKDDESASMTSGDLDALVLSQRRQLYRLLRAGGARWCTRCRWFQPPRAHHCRVCNTCIARMDHHCPWLGNCVGRRNYGDFLRFLLAVDGCLSFNLYLLACVALDSWRVRWGTPSSFVMGVILANMVLSTLVLIMVGGFSTYCFYLVMVNQTSIEASETSRAATLARRGRITASEALYPFTLGLVNNLLATLGARPWLWFVPTLPTCPATCPTPPTPPEHIPYALNAVLPHTQEAATSSSAADQTGWSYPTGVVDPLAQYRWPPRDPLRVMERQYRREHLANEAHSHQRGRRYNPHSRRTQDTWHEESASRRKSSRNIEPTLAFSSGPNSDDEDEGPYTGSSADSEDVPLAHLRRGGSFTLRRRKPAASINPGPAPSWAQGNADWKSKDDVERSSSSRSFPHPGEDGMEKGDGNGGGGILQHSQPTKPKSLAQLRMRRGSEGYEVRPVHFEQQLAPWAGSNPLAGEPPVQDQAVGSHRLLLPSEVLKQRAAAGSAGVSQDKHHVH